MYSQGSLFRLSDFLRGDEKYHIARVNLTSRHDISLHYHDYAEIAWIEKGSGKHFVNGQQIALSAGDLIMIRPTDSHAYYPSPEGITLMNVAFSLESLELYRNRYFPKGGMFFWTDSALPVQLNLPMNTIRRISARGEECMKHERSYMQLDGFLLFIFRLLTDYETKMSAEGMPQWLKNAINEFNKPGYFKGGGFGVRRPVQQEYRLCKPRGAQAYLDDTLRTDQRPEDGVCPHPAHHDRHADQGDQPQLRLLEPRPLLQDLQEALRLHPEGVPTVHTDDHLTLHPRLRREGKSRAA